VLNRDDARAWIDTLKITQVAVHPQIARKLYSYAELPIPDHLIPLQLKYRRYEGETVDRLEKAFLNKLWVSKARQSGMTWTTMDMVAKMVEQKLFNMKK
jgi:hypothetical protein